MQIRLDELRHILPEDTALLVTAGRKILDGEAEERLAHTKALIIALGFRMG